VVKVSFGWRVLAAVGGGVVAIDERYVGGLARDVLSVSGELKLVEATVLELGSKKLMAGTEVGPTLHFEAVLASERECLADNAIVECPRVLLRKRKRAERSHQQNGRKQGRSFHARSPGFENDCRGQIGSFGVFAGEPCGVDEVAKHSGAFSHASLSKRVQRGRASPGEGAVLFKIINIAGEAALTVEIRERLGEELAFGTSIPA
jgi:hypothetical protein